MRFTKIPLIATLMAVALSLLIVLPTLAQVSGDRTDGRLSVGSWIDARVADNIEDITTDTDTVAGVSSVPVIDDDPTHATGTNPFDAKDTFYDGNLYISNQEDAYNTILITAAVRDIDLADKDDGDAANGVEPCGATVDAAVATIRNDRSGAMVKAYLADTADVESAPLNDRTIYQGIAVVWDQEDAIEDHDGPCGTGPVMTDPTKYVGSAQQKLDAAAASITDVNTTPEDERDAYFPAGNDGWTTASAAVIPARDGDTITITVDGVSGSIRLVVDGDEPEIDNITPSSGGTQNSTTVNLGFTVSDDGSGLRYDGESGISGDPDLAPYNGDNDQRFDEPITSVGPTHDPGAATPVFDYGDGSTMDIMVLFDTDDVGDQKPYLLQSDTSLQVDDPLDSSVDPAVPNLPNPDYTGYRINFVASDDVSQYGSNDWTQRMRGVTYDLDMRLVGKDFGEYFWQITAKDRVGNMATTDSDEDEDGDQPFSFTVDDEGPKVPPEGARTGIGYESGEGEFEDRSWIALTFVNDESGGADRIDASTVTESDFTVEGHTVMNALVPSDKKICKGDDPRTDDEDESDKNITALDADDGGDKVLVPAGQGPGGINPVNEVRSEVAEKCEFEPRARIYLQLADELASDETPTIQLLGGVFKDIAGNSNITQSLEDVQDKIAPGIGITITSSSGATGRTATDDEGSFTVRVTSDEELNTFPRLFFATIKGGAPTDDGESFGAASGLTIASATPGLGKELTEKESNVWEKTFEDDDIEGSGDRIVAVIITAEDEADNSGNSAGWTDGDGDDTPELNEKLNFAKLDAGGFLLEIDSELAEATVTVLPSVDPGEVTDQTESMNPYIEIKFENELNEYGIDVIDNDGDLDNDGTEDADDAGFTADDGTASSVDIGDGDTARTDSHRGVAMTKLELNGENQLDKDAFVEVDPYTYVLAVQGLEIGEHTIVYTANDDVGNEVEDVEFTFEVLERQPYDITLQPGWNLISFPGDPFNPAVGNVIGSDLRADTVLGYQSGEWVTAVKNEDGRWQGTLSDIVGGYGYWVRTTAVEDIETVIPPILPTSNLPTVPVISGWNLLGVVDAEQAGVGDDDASHDADEYFTSLNVWRVAYSFETQQNRWMKLLPEGKDADGNPHMVANGKGYWVWSTRPGTLVP